MNYEQQEKEAKRRLKELNFSTDEFAIINLYVHSSLTYKEFHKFLSKLEVIMTKIRAELDSEPDNPFQGAFESYKSVLNK